MTYTAGGPDPKPRAPGPVGASPQGVPVQGAEPHAAFVVAAQDVLGMLLDRVGLDLWLATAVEGIEQTVLAARDRDADPGGRASGPAADRPRPGTVLSWQRSPCRLMVQGQVPQVVRRGSQVPGWTKTVRDLGLPTGSYVGVPLLEADGALLGTLCGFGHAERPDLDAALPLLHAVARLLSTITSRERDLAVERRESGRLRVLADHDPLTGLLNRRGWDAALGVEQERTRRTGTPTAVVTVDVDGLKRLNDSAGHGAGDRALHAVAEALRAAGRRGDPVARVGGDEFALLAVGLSDAGEAHRLADRVRRACARRGVQVSSGVAVGPSGQALTHTWQLADADMYTTRAAHRQRGGSNTPP